MRAAARRMPATTMTTTNWRGCALSGSAGRCWASDPDAPPHLQNVTFDLGEARYVDMIQLWQPNAPHADTYRRALSALTPLTKEEREPLESPPTDAAGRALLIEALCRWDGCEGLRQASPAHGHR